MAVGGALAASGRRYNRVLAIGGFAWAVREAHARVHEYTMAYVHACHEFVLAVRPSDLPAPVPAPPASATSGGDDVE